MYAFIFNSEAGQMSRKYNDGPDSFVRVSFVSFVTPELGAYLPLRMTSWQGQKKFELIFPRILIHDIKLSPECNFLKRLTFREGMDGPQLLSPC